MEWQRYLWETSSVSLDFSSLPPLLSLKKHACSFSSTDWERKRRKKVLTSAGRGHYPSFSLGRGAGGWGGEGESGAGSRRGRGVWKRGRVPVQVGCWTQQQDKHNQQNYHCHKDVKNNTSKSRKNTKQTRLLAHRLTCMQEKGGKRLGWSPLVMEPQSRRRKAQTWILKIIFLNSSFSLSCWCYLWSSDPPSAGARLQRDWLRSPPSVRWEHK